MFIKPVPRRPDIPNKETDHKLLQITAIGEGVPIRENWLKRWCALPTKFSKLFDKIINFQVRHDDVFVVTFPRCGTTWLQEAAWLLLNNLDYGRAQEMHLEFRSVFIEMAALNEETPRDPLELASKLPSPRVLKTHLPAHLMPKQIWQKRNKILYCARNPKDVIVSCFHYYKGLGNWQGNLDDFVDAFINNAIMYSPFWPGVMDFFQMRSARYVFFTTYEEMKRNLAGVICKLCIFLELPMLSDAQMYQLLEHLSFDSMKENKSIVSAENLKSDAQSADAVAAAALPAFQFMRRGIVSSYKDELSLENQLKIDAWSNEFLQRFNITEEQIFGKI